MRRATILAWEKTATAFLVAAVVLLGPACSSAPTEQALPPQTMAPPGPEIEEPVSTAPQEMVPEAGATAVDPAEEGDAGTGDRESSEEAANSARAEPNEEEITVVIEPPTEESVQPRSLVAAAEAERARRARTEESTIVITDKNLAEHAAGGQLTFVEEDEETNSANEAEKSDSGDALEESLADEQYWRDRVSDIRQAWRDAIDRIEELESRIAALRQDFYAEDDPFYRDSQIKPAWDRALEELEQARRRASEEKENLAVALEEGRRAGALPGWLREGLELEPTPEELEAVGEEGGEQEFHQPSEPVVLDEDENGTRTDGRLRR